MFFLGTWAKNLPAAIPFPRRARYCAAPMHICTLACLCACPSPSQSRAFVSHWENRPQPSFVQRRQEFLSGCRRGRATPCKHAACCRDMPASTNSLWLTSRMWGTAAGACGVCCRRRVCMRLSPAPSPWRATCLPLDTRPRVAPGLPGNTHVASGRYSGGRAKG